MNIDAVFDLSKNEWSVSSEGSEHPVLVRIGFISDVTPVVFSDLYFSWEASNDNGESAGAFYPKSGEKYISTDQEFLADGSVSFLPGSNCALRLWAKNDGSEKVFIYDFVSPALEKPHPSWVWSDGAWIEAIE